MFYFSKFIMFSFFQTDLSGVESFVWNMLQAGDPGWVPNHNSAALQAVGLGPAAAGNSSDGSSSNSDGGSSSSSDVIEFKEVVSELKLELKALRNGSGPEKDAVAAVIPTTAKSDSTSIDLNSGELAVALSEMKGELRALAASDSRGDGCGGGGESGGDNGGSLRDELTELKEAVFDIKTSISALTATKK
jgi:hypothetical protein